MVRVRFRLTRLPARLQLTGQSNEGEFVHIICLNIAFIHRRHDLSVSGKLITRPRRLIRLRLIIRSLYNSTILFEKKVN